MNTEIFVALLSLAGTLLGSLFGILTANRLTNYRLGQLEKKVGKHNHLVERMFQLEQDVAVLDNRQKVSEHRLRDLEQEQERRNIPCQK